MIDPGLVVSVQARLLNRARADRRDYNQLLIRYGLERLLYRLSISAYADYFLLKGALLFDLWFDVPLRPTRDIDLLGFGIAELPHVAEVFRAICAQPVQLADGMRFNPESVVVDEIRKKANYSGTRVKLDGFLGTARCVVQIDIGYGDAVTPVPESADYPVLLSDFPSPRLRVYPRYTVVAEKLEAIISLGIANTRMKDYFDLWMLCEHDVFDGEILMKAIHATLRCRKTAVPTSLPVGLSDAFADDLQKKRQWAAFLSRNALQSEALSRVVSRLRQWLLPPLLVLRDDACRQWNPQSGWQ